METGLLVARNRCVADLMAHALHAGVTCEEAEDELRYVLPGLLLAATHAALVEAARGRPGCWLDNTPDEAAAYVAAVGTPGHRTGFYVLCSWCQRPATVQVDPVDYMAWRRDGVPLAQAAPYLTAAEQHLLEYGRCSGCPAEE